MSISDDNFSQAIRLGGMISFESEERVSYLEISGSLEKTYAAPVRVVDVAIAKRSSTAGGYVGVSETRISEDCELIT
jgi:hypothetical protein